MPRPDLPFDEAFLDYARKALAMAGLEPDREWLSVRPLEMDIISAVSENRFYYQEARKCVPTSDAHWEQAQFISVALRAAIQDLQWGAINNYREFEFLYSRILGDKSRRFLPQLFVAAATSPSLDAEFSNSLMQTLPERDPYDE